MQATRDKKKNLKVHFYGGLASGKSELIQCLNASIKNKPYQFEEPYLPTIIAEHPPALPYTDIKTRETTHLRIWDISNSPAAHSYLQEEHACIVFTLDCTQELDEQLANLKEKIEIARKADSNREKPTTTSYLIVVTKSDIPIKKFTSEQVKAAAKQLGIEGEDILSCSAKANDKIDQIFPRIISKVAEDKKLNALSIQIKKEIIDEILLPELRRLQEKYPDGGDKGRIDSLIKSIEELESSLKNTSINPTRYHLTNENKTEELLNLLEKPIRDHLENFDKRKGVLGWGKKLARRTLNKMRSIFSSLISYLAPQKDKQDPSPKSPFFSLRGKTYEEGEKGLKKIKAIFSLKKG